MKGFGIPCLLSCLLSSPEPLRFWYGNGQASPIHPSVRRLFTFSNVRQPNVIKFHVKHHQIVGKTEYGFWADWIGTLLAMDDGNKAPIDIMGKSLKIVFTEAMRPTAYILYLSQDLTKRTFWQ